jgi:hypothetical protein
MTSGVKSGPPWVSVFRMFFPVSAGRAGASQTRRLLLLLSVDWLPPDL